MAWLAVDENGTEGIYQYQPERLSCEWGLAGDYLVLHKGTIKKLIGREPTWNDEPVELTDILIHCNSSDGSFSCIETREECDTRQKIIRQKQIDELGDIGKLID